MRGAHGLHETKYFRIENPKDLLDRGQLIQILKWNDQFYRPWRPK